MNAFNILSSSTRLQAIKETTKGLRLAGKDDRTKDPGNDTSRLSRKRKRSSLELDEAPLESVTGRKTVISPGKHEEQRDAEGIDSRIYPDPIVNDDDLRTYLRKHRIKLTQLYHPKTSKKLSPKTKKLSKSSNLNSCRGYITDSELKPLNTFHDLGERFQVSDIILSNLAKQHYSAPTEIQSISIPILLGSSEIHASSGKTDQIQDQKYEQPGTLACHLLSVAPTGSGKTLAYMIPLLHSIIVKQSLGEGNPSHYNQALPCGPKAIVIAPTKELAKQITYESRKLAHRSGIKVAFIAKGMRLAASQPPHRPSPLVNEAEPQEQDTKNKTTSKADVLVSTPLGLLNAIADSSGDTLDLPSVSNLVLDEADALLDPLFRDQTMSVLSACTNHALRLSLWSATVGSSIEEIARTTIQTRFEAAAKESNNQAQPTPLLRLVVGLKDSSIPNITHRMLYVASERGKLTTIRQILTAQGAAPSSTLAQIHPPMLVFTQTIPRAIALHAELQYDVPYEAGGPARIAVLHADLTDAARDRVMQRFRQGEVWILVTTDLLARGVDFHGVNAVINYDLPHSSAAYVHRAGRTGRAGRSGGVALTFYSQEDMPFVKNVANVIAASEEQRSDAMSADRKWMMDSLPKPSKTMKKMLKRRGVDSRHVGKIRDGNGRVRNSGSQISTKSGYERRKQNMKKGVVGR